MKKVSTMPIARTFTPRSSPRRIDLSPAEPPPPPVERSSTFEIDLADTLRSIAHSNGMVLSALELTCSEHSAKRGEYCWPTVRGTCMKRLMDGLAYVRPPLEHGELEPFAAATRRAQRRHGNRS